MSKLLAPEAKLARALGFVGKPNSEGGTPSVDVELYNVVGYEIQFQDSMEYQKPAKGKAGYLSVTIGDPYLITKDYSHLNTKALSKETTLGKFEGRRPSSIDYPYGFGAYEGPAVDYVFKHGDIKIAQPISTGLPFVPPPGGEGPGSRK